jgi:integrase
MFEQMGKRRGQRTGELMNRAGSWLLRYYVDGTEIDPKTNKLKRERVTVKIADSEGPNAVGIRQARRIAWEEKLSTLDQAHTRPSSAKTFLEFVNQRYRPDVIAYLKPSTRAFAESILGRHVLPLLGSTPLREITPAHIQAIVNSKKSLSPQTLTHIRNRIGAVLRHAKAHQWFFGEIPTQAVRLPEMQRKERRALTWAQVCELATALPEPAATLVIFLALSGLRIGEAMGLRWSRLNLTAELRIVDGQAIPPMSLLVRENYVMGRYQSLKTGTSYRTVPIPEWFAGRLLKLLSSNVSTEAPVFANSTKLIPLDQHNLAARVLKPAARALGMPWASWHCFRHSYNSLMDQAKMTQTERMKLMGHASAAVNLGYSHLEMDHLRPRIEAMVDPKKLN